jgi:hypothetical protein
MQKLQKRYPLAEGSPLTPAKGGSPKVRHRRLFYEALANKDPVEALEILKGDCRSRRIVYSHAEAIELLLDFSCTVIEALAIIPKEKSYMWCVAGSAVQHMRHLLGQNVVLHDAASQTLEMFRARMKTA